MSTDQEQNGNTPEQKTDSAPTQDSKSAEPKNESLTMLGKLFGLDQDMGSITSLNDFFTVLMEAFGIDLGSNVKGMLNGMFTDQSNDTLAPSATFKTLFKRAYNAHGVAETKEALIDAMKDGVQQSIDSGELVLNSPEDKAALMQEIEDAINEGASLDEFNHKGAWKHAADRVQDFMDDKGYTIVSEVEAKQDATAEPYVPEPTTLETDAVEQKQEVTGVPLNPDAEVPSYSYDATGNLVENGFVSTNTLEGATVSLGERLDGISDGAVSYDVVQHTLPNGDVVITGPEAVQWENVSSTMTASLTSPAPVQPSMSPTPQPVLKQDINMSGPSLNMGMGLA